MSLAVGARQAAGGWAGRAERALGHLVEASAALLAAAEIGILFVGVVARFVFHRPIVWTDELASILFLWLAMLGAVIALQRGQHMRLTAVVAGMAPGWRGRAEALAVGASAVFLLLILPHAAEYASDEWYIETPALGWSNMVRAGAIPVGAALMLASCLLHLLRERVADVLLVAAGLLAVGAGLYLLGPALKGAGNWNLMLFFVLLLGTGVLLGVPIGFSFGLATLAYLATTTSTPLTVVVSRMDEGMSALILLAVPLFVFLGLLIEMTGMGAGDGRVPREPAGPREGRAVLRAAGGDVPGQRHIGVEGRGHGRRRPGAVPRDEAPRRQRGRVGLLAVSVWRHERDDPAVAGADHHRIGDGRQHRRAVHRPGWFRRWCWRRRWASWPGGGRGTTMCP